MKSLISILVFSFILSAQSFAESYLVKFDSTSKSNFFQSTLNDKGFKVKKFEFLPWFLIKKTSTTKSISGLEMKSFLQSLRGHLKKKPHTRKAVLIVNSHLENDVFSLLNPLFRRFPPILV